jgi:Arc/MetJ family transcription regulator
MMQKVIISDAGAAMRTTISVDDVLYEQALEYAGPDVSGASDLVREAIKVYVRVQAAKRLAALGGTVPDMHDIPRRREPVTP